MNKFESITKPLTWLMALLLAAVVAGCGGGNETWTPAGSAKAITAFSIGTNVGTIDQTAKTIAVGVPTGTAVTALVATYTSTGTSVKVGTAAQTSGVTPNDFTAPVIYTVTAADSTRATYTATVTVAAPPGPNLRRTASFAVLAGTSITNTGTTTVTGDVGAASLTGAALTVTGTGLNDTACATTACQNAIADLPTVLSEANNTTSFPCGTSISGNLTGVALTPGVTCISADAAILNTGIVTLNGPGVYIIRTAGGLTPAASSSVAFGAGTNDTNTTVFWVVGSANLGSPSTWMGTILSSAAVIVGDTDTLNKGRVFTPGPITLSNNTIVKP